MMDEYENTEIDLYDIIDLRTEPYDVITREHIECFVENLLYRIRENTEQDEGRTPNYKEMADEFREEFGGVLLGDVEEFVRRFFEEENFHERYCTPMRVLDTSITIPPILEPREGAYQFKTTLSGLRSIVFGGWHELAKPWFDAHLDKEAVLFAGNALAAIWVLLTRARTSLEDGKAITLHLDPLPHKGLALLVRTMRETIHEKRKEPDPASRRPLGAPMEYERDVEALYKALVEGIIRGAT